ncbi:DUF6541 family protein [Ornithinicoccus hortensis]|uniref:4-amino-4-deoxy-L-arabinose transferase-like glycosyltransferase n=1 Tax=Ornithinicoccus hortensis TaxID=82346 RepID=A0A542YTJ1_9MICO|nr:DUF6541 family protein [Ornithinicoccus hortensis]TQL51412.1 hypothetical protein FB467_2558 [Ornithinicoccus hortensis]
MTWWVVLPGLVLMAALWVLPGYAVLRALGVRGLVAWGAGPALTSGAAGILAIGYDLIGLRWTVWTFLGGCLVLVGIAALLGWRLGTWNDPAGERIAGEHRMSMRERRWLALSSLVGGGILAAAMMTGIGRADMPLQAWDGVYHLNALWVIREFGNASSLGGLAPLYADTIAPYYPTVWHSIVAVVPGFEGVTEAANASSIVIGTVIWMGGLVALSRVVWPGRPLPVIFTPLLAATYVAFPAIAVSMLGVWPFAVSVACLPGTLALLIVALRGDQPWRLHLAHGLGFLGALSGVVLAHGSGLFSIALLAAPLLTVLLARQGRRFWRRGHKVPVAVAAVVIVTGVVGLTLFLLDFPPLQAIVGYQRGGSPNYWGAIGSTLIDHPLIYVYPFQSFNIVVTALVFVGVWITIRNTHARWLVVALVATWLLTLLAAGPPENPLRVLAGFWYTQASRLNQLLVIPAVVLAAGGASLVARKVADRFSVGIVRGGIALAVVVVVATFGLRWPSQTTVMSSVYSTWPIAWGTMIDSYDELAMIDRAGETLPEDAVVLGEPINGSPYLLARSGVDVVYPQLTGIADSPERVLLQTDFDRPASADGPATGWWKDPAVCEAVNALGVTHVYTDDLTFEEGGKWEETTPGLRDVDPHREGFGELVDEGGQAQIWRFTGCDR